MKKLLFSLLLLTSLSHAKTHEWILLNETSEMKTYGLKNSIIRNGDIRYFWQKQELQKDEFKGSYNIAFKELNCKEKTSRIIASDIYGMNGQFLGHGEINKQEIVIPDSLGEYILKLICKVPVDNWKNQDIPDTPNIPEPAPINGRKWKSV